MVNKDLYIKLLIPQKILLLLLRVIKSASLCYERQIICSYSSGSCCFCFCEQ